MAIIYSYPTATPKASDLLIGTVTYDSASGAPVDGNPTRTFSIGDIANLVSGYALSSQAAGVNANIVLTSSLGAITAVNLLRGTGISISDNGSNGITLGNTGVLSIVASNSTFVSSTPVLSATGNVTISSSLSAVGTPSSSNYLRGDNRWSTPVTTITTQDSQYINLTPNSSSNGAVTITAQLSAAGAPSSSNFLRGDNVWAVPAGGGTVTSVNAGTGIAVDNSNPSSPIINNTGVLSNIAGNGISISGATGNSTITNTAPDQTVVITGSGDTTVTGTYPNFNVSSDSGVTQIVAGNDISISPIGGTGIVTINSTSQGGVTSLIAGNNITLNPIDGLGDVTITSINTTYSAGADIDVTNEVITNTAPDQVVAITGTGAAVVSGTYPNFNVDVVAGEQGVVSKDSFVGNGIETQYQLSVTPTSATYTEVFISGVYQDASTYTLSADTITLSAAPDSGDTLEIVTFNLGTPGSGGGGGAVDSIIAGTGISVSGPTGNVTITNNLPDQTVALTGAGGTTITGTYPNFTVSSTAGGGGVDSVVGGTSITVDNTDPLNPIINNSSPDQTVALTGSGAATVTGTYPSFNVATPVVNTADFITNANDVYPSVNKVTDIISLTQAEYNALTPDESAIYVIIG